MNTQLRRLRPLGITDILDETVDLYKTNFKLLVGISAVLYVPYTMISSFLRQPKFDATSFDPFAWLSYGILGLLFYILVNPLVTGALTFAISDRYLGRETTIADCYKRVAQPGVFFGFIGATFLTGLLTSLSVLAPAIMIGIAAALMAGVRNGSALAIGIILLLVGVGLIIVPIWVALRFTLVAPTFIIEAQGVKKSLRRSWNLMGGNALKAFGLLLISGTVVGVIQGLVVAPVTLLSVQGAIHGADPALWVTALQGILNSAVTALLMPITSTVLILLYYDIRIRKEGFDLELLANELDHKTREMSAHDITSLPQEQIIDPEHEATTRTDGQQ